MTTETDSSADVSILVAHRLTQLEGGVQAVNSKLDQFFNIFVTKEYLELFLKPHLDKIKELEAENVENKTKREQYKFITYGAIISPVVSVLLSALIVMIGLKSGG